MDLSGGGNENTPVGQNGAPNQRDSMGSRGGKRTATEGVQYNENIAAPALRASKCKSVEVRLQHPQLLQGCGVCVHQHM